MAESKDVLPKRTMTTLTMEIIGTDQGEIIISGKTQGNPSG
jgi:hypothetical protein